MINYINGGLYGVQHKNFSFPISNTQIVLTMKLFILLITFLLVTNKVLGQDTAVTVIKRDGILNYDKYMIKKNIDSLIINNNCLLELIDTLLAKEVAIDTLKIKKSYVFHLDISHYLKDTLNVVICGDSSIFIGLLDDSYYFVYEEYVFIVTYDDYRLLKLFFLFTNESTVFKAYSRPLVINRPRRVYLCVGRLFFQGIVIRDEPLQHTLQHTKE